MKRKGIYMLFLKLLHSEEVDTGRLKAAMFRL